MNSLRRFTKQHRTAVLVASQLGVWAAATLIFALRNRTAFRLPNFYAEDATVLFGHIYTTDPIHALLTLFNGYLIVGQYLLAYLAAGINGILGNNLANLPIVVAIVSCAFLGLVASLPYLLFRKELGTLLSLLVVLLTAFVPMYSYDYAIIGTISNLKFVFSYVAFLLILYRFKALSAKQYVMTDAGLLLCVLTNAPTAIMVPLILIPYIRQFVVKRDITLTLPVVSGAVVTGLSLLYVAAAVLKGIPKIPGYLDQPFGLQSLLPYIDRSTLYAWTYPITTELNSYFVAWLLLLATGWVALLFWRRKADRIFIAVFVWSIAVSTILLAVNRPGIGQLYLTYLHKGGADQFFYAQSMTVIFATAWLVRDWFKRLPANRLAWVLGVGVVYMTIAIPHGTSFGGSAAVYKTMQPIKPNLQKACRQYARQDRVIIQIYPTPYWQWYAPKQLACHSQQG